MSKDTTDVNARKSSSCFWLILVFFILSLLDTIPILRLRIAHEERIRTVQVGNDVPDNFPVLVFASQDKSGHRTPSIVFYVVLDEYLEAHPDYSYTLPKEQVRQANAELKKYSDGVGSFTMIERDGKESFKVEENRDDDRVIIGWYEANGRSFTPKKYVTYFGPGICMKYTPIIVFGNVIATLLFAGIVRKIKR